MRVILILKYLILYFFLWLFRPGYCEGVGIVIPCFSVDSDSAVDYIVFVTGLNGQYIGLFNLYS